MIIRSVNRQIVGITMGQRPFLEKLEGLPRFADQNASPAVPSREVACD